MSIPSESFQHIAISDVFDHFLPPFRKDIMSATFKPFVNSELGMMSGWTGQLFAPIERTKKLPPLETPFLKIWGPEVKDPDRPGRMAALSHVCV